MIGDVFFGGGVTPSTLTIIGPDASVSGAISSGGTVDIMISGDGSGGTLNTSGVRNAGIFDVGVGGAVDLAIGQDLGPLIDAQGASNFAAGSSLTLTPIAFLAETTAGSPYELIKADGGLCLG